MDTFVLSEERPSAAEYRALRLMQVVTDYFDRNARPGATIILIPQRGGESSYERFGFARCPDGPFGIGMHYTSVPPPDARASQQAL